MIVLNWHEVKPVYLSRKEWNKLVEILEKQTILKKIPESNFKRYAFYDNTYQILSRGISSAEARIYLNGYIKVFKFVNSTDEARKRINESEYTPKDYYNLVDNSFKQENNGISILKAYSGRNFKGVYTAIKKCVPAPPNFALPTPEPIDNCYKADVSSCYPSQLCKKLPTLKGYKLAQGRVEPDEDYPFAFYLKSHHMKIHNELDSRDFLNVFYFEYYTKIYLDNISANEDVTILCKASKYSFEKVMKKLYYQRKEKPWMKDAMNITIGCFQKNGNPVESHLAAVVLARCVNDMCARAKQLVDEGNTVYLINTDSIIWGGKPSSIAVPESEKDLGKFVLEEKNISAYIKSCKCYQYMHNNKDVISKHSGVKGIDNSEFGDIIDMTKDLKKRYKRVGDRFLEVKNG